MVQNFQVNSLNELTANTNGGTLTVMGTTTSRATNVTVNSSAASIYGDATFAAPGIGVGTTYTAIASDNLGRSATNTVNVSVATNTTFQYDGNGNLTNDGLRVFAYDNENQLISVQVPGQYFSQFTYDGKMRRRIRQEYTSQGGAWVLTNAVYYIYDGNEVIQERNLNNLPTTTYTRGQDLSGSLERAGGIGGLLARTSQAYSEGPMAGQSYYHCDANGNVTILINSSNAIVAKYLYDAVGNILSKSGLLADANLYRFSSKEAHPNSGLVYYLYRYYDPNLQRWPNRDPIGELGGFNLYRFNANSPICFFDPSGENWIGAIGGVFSGGISGAISGAITGGIIGFVGSGFNPAGAIIGATAGATAGAIGGAIAGGISGAISAQTVPQGIQNGVLPGVISGTISGITAGIGSWAGATGSGLNHFSEAACTISKTGQLGTSASSDLWATTGAQWATTVTGDAVPITGSAATAFTPVTAFGPFTGFQAAAGFQSAGSGILNLGTGAWVAGGGVNGTVIIWGTIDAGFNGGVGVITGASQ